MDVFGQISHFTPILLPIRVANMQAELAFKAHFKHVLTRFQEYPNCLTSRVAKSIIGGGQ
jgi:hypothetical protein